MIVGELRHGQLTIIDRIRETVRLAEGLSDSGDLSPDARSRALHCLSIFGERLREMHAASVRAAGTSTIRRAREDTGFMASKQKRRWAIPSKSYRASRRHASSTTASLTACRATTACGWCSTLAAAVPS